jgi:hypothetical protein
MGHAAWHGARPKKISPGKKEKKGARPAAICLGAVLTFFYARTSSWWLAVGIVNYLFVRFLNPLSEALSTASLLGAPPLRCCLVV